MERYSDRAIEIINELHRERLDYYSEYLPLIDAANKLSAYEDTGLEPEQVISTMGRCVSRWPMQMVRRMLCLQSKERHSAGYIGALLPPLRRKDGGGTEWPVKSNTPA